MHPVLILSPCSAAYRELGNITERTKIEYAHWHKCATWFPDYPTGGTERFADRLKFCVEAWKRWPNYTILFMGADAMIVNMKIDVRAYINTDFDIAAAWDVNGLQSDVMLLNPHDRTMDALDKTFVRHQADMHLPGLAGTDQGAFVTTLSGLSRYVNDLPVDALQRLTLVHELPKTFNRYLDDFQLNDFVFHACNRPMDERIRLCTALAKQIVHP